MVGEGFESSANCLGDCTNPGSTARNPARSPTEAHLLDLWERATNYAKLKAIEILQADPDQLGGCQRW